MKKEIWKAIKGYEGIYEASNWGRVKSLARELSDGRRWKEKILKPGKSGGYLTVNLCKDGICKNYQVHQLVAIAFLDHEPNGYKIVVDHKNNNPLDNRLENLNIISHRENISKDRTGCSSKYTGVSWMKSSKKWIAYITIDGKRKHLGYFINELKASEAYQSVLSLLERLSPSQVLDSIEKSRKSVKTS